MISISHHLARALSHTSITRRYTMVAWKEYVDTHENDLVDRLRKAVAIPSVSGEAKRRPDVFRMADWLVSEWEKVGAKLEKVPLGPETLHDGTTLDLPPALLGAIGDDPNKKTILVYGHYDVQPAYKTDGWDHDPFELQEDKETGVLRGRGSSDDKGPILGWLNVVEAHVKTNTELPVNLRMCFEGMEESGSVGLDKLVIQEAGTRWKDVDAVCISDNYWLGTKKPCITYGLRGIAYYTVKIKGPASDLHSGVFGGMVNEPMTDLAHIFSKLVKPDGTILIPGVTDLVEPLAEDEVAIYENIDFSAADAEAAAGSKVIAPNDKAKMLMSRMRYSSLSLHGIEGAFSTPGAKTVIPGTVQGKFSIRLVPNQTPEAVDELVIKYIKDEFAKLGSSNTIEVFDMHGGKPWIADHKHWNYEAAIQATKNIYSQDPDLTREGGSIPITLTFQEALNRNILLLPMGRGDDGAHGPQEKLDKSNYINGTKLLGEYLHQVSLHA